MLDSKRIIAQRALSYCKDNFPPHKADRIFLQKSSKFVNYDIQANLELDKLNANTFECGDTKNKMHAFNANDLSRNHKIM